MAIDFKTKVEMSVNPVAAPSSSESKISSRIENFPADISRQTNQTGQIESNKFSEDNVNQNRGSLEQQAEVQDALERLSSYVKSMQRELSFTVDKESGKTIIKVIDSETKQVVRQIPPEEIVNVAHRIGEMREGILFRGEA